jgi:two-component system, LytTR family, sensor kinase
MPNRSADVRSDGPHGVQMSVPPYRWSALPLGQRVTIVAGWAVLGIIETVRVVRDPTSIGVQSIPWVYAFLGNFPWWFAWALLTPLVFALADRYRLDEAGWPARLPLQVIGGIAIIAVHLPMALAFWYWTNPMPQVRAAGFVGSVIRLGLGPFLLQELLAFSATLGLFYAVDNHRRLHLRELESVRLAERAATAEAAASSARLDALQLELSPHFLFNSLNAIGGLIRNNEPATAVRVIAQLGDMLRLSLSRDRSAQIPLSLELQHLERYLGIERLRFRDRLTVTTDADPDTGDCLVPVMILQPLAENAVKHGVSTMPGAAHVTVKCRLDGAARQLVLTVLDDGPGFPLFATTGAGIGLRNTRARLAQLHGDSARLEITTPDGGGACVVVRLPIVFAPAPTGALAAADA